MRIFIWVRATSDWSSVSSKNIGEVNKVWQKNFKRSYDPEYNQIIIDGCIEFEKHVKQTYGEVRSMFVDVANQNREDILRNDTVEDIIYGEYPFTKLPKDAYIIPTDDDDLLHPGIGNYLQDENLIGYTIIWNLVSLRHDGTIHASRQMFGGLSPSRSNNFAVPLDVFLKMVPVNDHYKHEMLAKYENTLYINRYVQLFDRLSGSVKHVTATSHLKNFWSQNPTNPTIQIKQSKEKFHENSAWVNKDAVWFIKYYRMLKAVYDQIELR
jgi:hypothetical protein